jgi:hypothetical protein
MRADKAKSVDMKFFLQYNGGKEENDDFCFLK